MFKIQLALYQKKKKKQSASLIKKKGRLTKAKITKKASKVPEMTENELQLTLHLQ